jgi:hypothetical protein
VPFPSAAARWHWTCPTACIASLMLEFTDLSDRARDALLVVAAAGGPGVEALLSALPYGRNESVDVLEQAEAAGIIDYDPETADAMAAARIAFCPTLGASLLVPSLTPRSAPPNSAGSSASCPRSCTPSAASSPPAYPSCRQRCRRP